MFNAKTAHSIALKVARGPVEEQIRIAANQGKFLIHVMEIHTETVKYLCDLGYNVDWEGTKSAFISCVYLFGCSPYSFVPMSSPPHRIRHSSFPVIWFGSLMNSSVSNKPKQSPSSQLAVNSFMQAGSPSCH